MGYPAFFGSTGLTSNRLLATSPQNNFLLQHAISPGCTDDAVKPGLCNRTLNFCLFVLLPYQHTKLLHLIRHAKRRASIMQQRIGQQIQDAHLTAVGWQQARELNSHLRSSGIKVDLVIVSPLNRTLETAAAVLCFMREIRSSQSNTLLWVCLDSIFIQVWQLWLSGSVASYFVSISVLYILTNWMELCLGPGCTARKLCSDLSHLTIVYRFGYQFIYYRYHYTSISLSTGVIFVLACMAGRSPSV